MNWKQSESAFYLSHRYLSSFTIKGSPRTRNNYKDLSHARRMLWISLAILSVTENIIGKRTTRVIILCTHKDSENVQRDSSHIDSDDTSKETRFIYTLSTSTKTENVSVRNFSHFVLALFEFGFRKYSAASLPRSFGEGESLSELS